MTTFLIDLWHDLREKRLWPVAVGLLAATAAIPLILFKPASSAPVATSVAQGGSPATQLPAVNVESGPGGGSTLNTFHQKDPFRPMTDLGTPSATPGSTSTPSSTPSGSSASGRSSGSAAGSGAGGGAPKSGGGSPSSGGGSSSGSTGGGSSNSSVTWFAYTADLKFGTPDRMKTMKKVPAMTVLPNDTVAAIVFMGVSVDGKHANFFIADTSFEPQGEGKCNAKGSACRIVTLSLSDSGNEEAFVSKDGTSEYDVKLVAVHRSSLADAQAKGARVPTRGKAATGAGEGALAGSFVPPLVGLPAIARVRK